MATFLLALHVASCTGWKIEAVGPRNVIESQQPSRARVTLRDGAALVIDRPRVIGDSIVSMDRSCRPSLETGTTVCEDRPGSARVALTDVSSVETHRLHVWRTVGVVAGVAILAAFLPFIGYALSGSDCCSLQPGH